MNIKKCVYFFVIILSFFLAFPGKNNIAQAVSNIPNNNFYVTNGNVNTSLLSEDGKTLYIGGAFTVVGPQTGGGAEIDLNTGKNTKSSPLNINGQVYTTISDGSGGWYIGGYFSSVGRYARNNLAHILADGSVDPDWDPNVGNGSWSVVRTMVVSNSIMYIGGYFANIGGQTRNNIAALDIKTGLVTNWNSGTNSYVNSLVINNSVIYVGGEFTSIGGQIRNRIAALDVNTGLVTSWDPNSDSTVYTLSVKDSTIYVGGGFSNIGGQPRKNIVAFDIKTGLVTEWNPVANGTVRTIITSNSTIYAAGDFTAIGSQARNRIGALDINTGIATDWNPNADGTVRAMLLKDSVIYIGGSFTNIGGQARNKIAALDINTGIATDFKSTTDDDVVSISIYNSKIYFGGYSKIFGGEMRSGIAAINTDTGLLTDLNLNLNNYGSVKNIIIEGRDIYIGGYFTKINDQDRTCVASFNKNTGELNSWSPLLPSGACDVTAMTVYNNTLYIGGGFTRVDSQIRNHIAAFNMTTGALTDWNPNVSLNYANNVFSLLASGSTVYVGGYFTNIGGQARNNIAAIDINTGLATDWNPNANGNVLRMKIKDQLLYVSGDTRSYIGSGFTVIGGQTRNSFAALDLNTGQASDLDLNLNGGVSDFTIEGQTIYLGGSFSNVNGKDRAKITALDLNTKVASAWNPSPDSNVNTITISTSTVYVGGNYINFKNGSRSYLASFVKYGLDAISFSPSLNETNVKPNAKLVINFNDNVSAVSNRNIKIIKHTESYGNYYDETMETILADSSSVVVSGHQVTITPQIPFEESTNYSVTIDQGAFKNSLNAEYDGSSDWTFDVGDVTPPTLSYPEPYPGSIDVDINTQLILHFSENILVGSGNITVKKYDDDSVFAAVKDQDYYIGVDGSDATIYFNSFLGGGSKYSVFIEPGAFTDLIGNKFEGITNKDDFTFTTKYLQKPSVISLSPTNNSLGIDKKTTLDIQFDSVLYPVSGKNIVIKKYADDSIVSTIAVDDWEQVEASGNYVKISPTAILDKNTRYYITIDQGAFRNLFDLEYDGISSKNFWNFTIGEIVEPKSSFNNKLDIVDYSGVSALALSDNPDDLYVGGNFYRDFIPSGASIDLNSGNITNPSNYKLSKINDTGKIYAVAADGFGGWYIGGSFTNVGGYTRTNLAHILADGSVDVWNPNVDNIVYSIATSSSAVYIGGTFTNIGGYGINSKYRNRLAAIDINTGIATSWDPNSNNIIYSLVISTSTVYVGGTFTNVGGSARPKIAALDINTGLAKTWAPAATATNVRSIAISGSKVYVGGTFTAIGGQTRKNLAALDINTGLASTWSPAPDSIVYSLAISSSTIYVGGNFVTIGGQSRKKIASFTLSTGTITTWNPNIDNTVNVIAISSSTVYAGGLFTTVGSQNRSKAAAIDMSTGLATAWNPDVLDGSVAALALSDSAIYIGGSFADINLKRNFSKLNAKTGDVKKNFKTSTYSNNVRVLKNKNKVIYIGGDFTSIEDQTRNNLAAIDSETGTVIDFNPDVSGVVKAIDTSDSTIYIGGDFTSVGGQTRNYLAAIDSETGTVLDFNPDVNGSIYTIYLQGSILYVGGQFTSIGGVERNNLAAIDINTGVVTDWNPNVDGGNVNSIKIKDGVVYIGGTFYFVGGVERNYLAAIDIDTGLVTDWNPIINDSVNALEIKNSALYLSGYFYEVNGKDINFNNSYSGNTVALDTETGNLMNWNLHPDELVNQFVFSTSTLYLGGFFRNIDRQANPLVAAFDIVPIVSSFSPVVAASAVGSNDNLVIKFDSNILAIPGKNIVIKKYSDNSVFETIAVDSDQVNISGRTVTINPLGTFDKNTNYYVLIDSGSFADSDGNLYQGISSQDYWFFDTYVNHSLTYTAGEGGILNGVLDQSIREGDTGSAILAVPNSGYDFEKWSDDSTMNPRTDSNIFEDIAISAIFKLRPSEEPSGDGSGDGKEDESGKGNINNGSSPVNTPVGTGSGTNDAFVPFGSNSNVGTITSSGTNILTYINNQNIFSTSESSSHWSQASHSLQITNLDLNTNIATIVLSSTPQTITLKKGESKEVDLDGDKKNDILVTFSNVLVNRAEITVKSLSSQTSLVDKPIITSSVTTQEQKLTTKIDTKLIKKLAGRILLQTETKGQAWYLDTVSLKRYYLADGPTAYLALRKFGLGITNTDLSKIPVAKTSALPSDYIKSTKYSTSLTNKLKGRIVLQTENHGEAWYINPTDGTRYYLANGEAAYQIMRNLSLGISNINIRKIGVGSLE